MKFVLLQIKVLPFNMRGTLQLSICVLVYFCALSVLQLPVVISRSLPANNVALSNTRTRDRSTTRKPLSKNNQDNFLIFFPPTVAKY